MTAPHLKQNEEHVDQRTQQVRFLARALSEAEEKERVFKEKAEGRGLRAMQNRLELLGGDMHIDTAPGKASTSQSACLLVVKGNSP